MVDFHFHKMSCERSIANLIVSSMLHFHNVCADFQNVRILFSEVKAFIRLCVLLLLISEGVDRSSLALVFLFSSSLALAFEISSSSYLALAFYL